MSYTNTNSIKIITTGDEAGTWGDSTNINLKILDVASRGFLQLTISDGDQTLTLTDQPTDIENGHYHAIEFKGSISQERTITLEQNDHKLVYMVLNNAGNTLRFKQGDGTGGGSANAGTVTIANGKAGIILADGLGTNAKIVDLTASVDVSTATALATARNFSITGDVTANAVSFDGTGNVALSTAFASGVIVNADVNASAAIDATKIADGTVTSTEFQYINSLSSNAQTQIDSKQATITGAATTIASSDLTADRVVTSNGSGKIEASSTITTTELGHLNNVSSNIQTQLDAKQATITGAATTIDDADLTASRVLVSNSSGKVAVSSTTTTSLGNFIDGSALNASNLSSGTVPDARLPSSISSDITGNAATATSAGIVTTAAQTNITSLGTLTALTVDDITINGSTISDSGVLTISSGSVITLDADNDIHLDATDAIRFYEAGNLAGGIVLDGPNNTYTFNSSTSVGEMKIGDGGVTVLRGLRVGDNGTATDNDIHAVADITAGGGVTAGGDITATGAVDGVSGIEVNGTSVINSSRVLQNVTGLKTVNSTSILGSGNIAISDTNTGVGIGQSWSDQTSSRAADGTVYQNTTGSPIQVSISAEAGGGGTSNFQGSSDNNTYVTVSSGEDVNNSVSFGGIVPNNHYYKVAVASGSIILTFWSELR